MIQGRRQGDGVVLTLSGGVVSAGRGLLQPLQTGVKRGQILLQTAATRLDRLCADRQTGEVRCGSVAIRIETDRQARSDVAKTDTQVWSGATQTDRSG